MLVQERADRLRLIKQYDHALVAGKLAYQWRGLEAERHPLSFEVVVATMLHDYSWSLREEQPQWNPDTGRPYSFLDYPGEASRQMYAEGLDQVSQIHPYAGLLGSLHYSTFQRTQDSESFQNRERQRRKRLRGMLGLDESAEPRLQRELRYLKLFDTFSLFIGLTAPAYGRPLALRETV